MALLNFPHFATVHETGSTPVAARPNEMFKGEESVISIFRVTTDRLSAFEELHSTFDGSIRFVEATMKSSIKVGSQHMKDLIVDYFRGRG